MTMMKFKRRQRTNFSKHQLDTLNAVFNITQYPEPPVRNDLARRTNLDPSRIQVWFQNQRAKDKKRLKSSDDSPTSNGHQQDSQTSGSIYNGSLGCDLIGSPPLYNRSRDHNQNQNHSYNNYNSNNNHHRHHGQFHHNNPNQQYQPASKRHLTDPFDDFIDDSHRTLSPFDDMKHNLILQDQYASDYYKRQSIRGKQAKPQTIHVFDTNLANEAAEAVVEGKFESILQFHKSRYGTSTCTPWLPR